MKVAKHRPYANNLGIHNVRACCGAMSGKKSYLATARASSLKVESPPVIHTKPRPVLSSSFGDCQVRNHDI